jgi:hypothetical protein
MTSENHLAEGCYRFADGRVVDLEKLVIEETYSGWLEIGRWEQANARVLEELPGRANRLLGPLRKALPVVVVRPSTLADGKQLPGLLWVAGFKTLERIDDEKWNRHSLCVCWFTLNLGDAPRNVIQSVVGSVDWGANASRVEVVF